MNYKDFTPEEILAIAAKHRITPRSQQTPPPAPKRPRVRDSEAAMRQIVWEAAFAAGLSKPLIDWALVDLPESKGNEPHPEAARWREHPDAPIDLQVPFTPETVEMAAILLIEHRTTGHPFLHDAGPYDFDNPVWSEHFELPPGLAYQLPGNGLRTTMLRSTGVGRWMVPETHVYETQGPRGLHRWLLPVEVLAYLNESGF